MTRHYLRLVDGLSRLFGVIAGLLLVAAMLVVVEMIFIRYVFRSQTIWQTDFVVFSATAAIFLGAPYVLLRRAHVGVDFVELMVSDRTRRVLRLIGAVLGLAFVAMMFVASAIYFHEAWVGEWRTSTMWAPPLWIPLLPLPIGFGLLTLQYIAEIIRLSGGEA